MRVATVARPRAVSIVWVSMALVFGGFAGSSSPSIAAESAAADAVAHEQPKVVPAEFNGDVRNLPMAPSGPSELRPYRPLLRPPSTTKVRPLMPEAPSAPEPPIGPRVPMPSPIQNFAGMSFSDACTGGQCGAGFPPDINGDVGPNHYVEAVNDAIAIYSKTGTLLASFTENSLWAGAASPPCTGHSQGDPVVIYDWLVDRFIITWFAFNVSGNNLVGPYYQCIAASKTSDPVTGGQHAQRLRQVRPMARLPVHGGQRVHE